MYYIFHGSDTDKARAKVHAFLEALFKKRPDAQVFHLDSDSFDEGELKRLAQEQGLFETKHIVFLDRVCEDTQNKEVFTNVLSDMASSPNMFVVLEGVLTKTALKPFEKHAEDVYVFEEPQKKINKEEFNVFSLTDALCSRNKGKTWALYQQALLAGKTPEEIHGLLHWQVRSVVLAARSSSVKESGLNPFVYKKSRAAAERFSQEELRLLSKDLVSVYHKSRMGEGELADNLELFLLRRV